MKKILSYFQITITMLMFFSFQGLSQNNNAVNSSVHPIKLELKILSALQEKDIAKMEDCFNNYPGKILGHSCGENKNKVFVIISDNVDPLDILQVLKMKGIRACYKDSDNGYVSLESDGHSTRKLYFKE